MKLQLQVVFKKCKIKRKKLQTQERRKRKQKLTSNMEIKQKSSRNNPLTGCYENISWEMEFCSASYLLIQLTLHVKEFSFCLLES
ncbi:CLUMA_CG014763, isoform A [Clunio marinus]|uniref:CLUMA_CG014763, isoform A n=1 Tax=Clunio marinus TaxID=568069 RepID=A0A1J1IRL0_9DIPT|nr:CLUMA_CG014763, isoform A [Clunio marinus]